MTNEHLTPESARAWADKVRTERHLPHYDLVSDWLDEEADRLEAEAAQDNYLTQLLDVYYDGVFDPLKEPHTAVSCERMRAVLAKLEADGWPQRIKRISNAEYLDSYDNPRTPRVWQAGDPEPEGDVWVRDRNGVRRVGTSRYDNWDLLAFPVTEVLGD